MEASRELAQRDDVGGEVALRKTPIPAFLRDLGVQIVESVVNDEGDKARIVVIPGEVRQRVNVIDPVTSLVQADPNWTPRVSVVQLDQATHFYPQQGGKLAPSKQGLETLAKAAGVLYTRASRIPRDELAPGERYAYRATIGVRRSDGTVEELTREKTWVEEAERAEIEDAVRGNARYKTAVEQDAEIRKRWLKELKDAPAKTESKAVLRAIRAALQIPHTFTPADAAKPFLVIGFNFTPDYDDADVKRALVAAGLNAQAAIYGPRATETRALPAPHDAPADTGDVQATDARRVDAAGDDQQAGAAADHPAAAPVPGDDVDGEPGPPADEPTPDFEGPREALEDPAVVAAQAASQLVVPIGQWKGRGLAEVLNAGEKGVSWLLYALRNFDDATGTGPNSQPRLRPGEFVEALRAFTRVYEPETFQQALAEKEANAA